MNGPFVNSMMDLLPLSFDREPIVFDNLDSAKKGDRMYYGFQRSPFIIESATLDVEGVTTLIGRHDLFGDITMTLVIDAGYRLMSCKFSTDFSKTAAAQ